jgi:hypothetical protein
MSKSGSAYGKPLKGIGSLSDKLLGPFETSITNLVSGGSIPLGNVNITGGTIDGVVIGNNTPGPGVFTSLSIGAVTGVGFDACFFGTTVGESACWEAGVGLWNVQADLLVRDISTLGNLRIFQNTITTTNLNGNLILDTNGLGKVNIVAPIDQFTPLGDIKFETQNGLFSLNTSSSITLSSDNKGVCLIAEDNDACIKTGTNKQARTISNISTGLTPLITTTLPHLLELGDSITLAGTNSTPVLTGKYIVTSVPSTTTFRVAASSSITAEGTTGTVIRVTDINLHSADNVNILEDSILTFGADTEGIYGNGSDLVLTSSGIIELQASTKVNVPDNVPVTFGGDALMKIESDGTDLSISTSTGKLIVNGDLQVNGTTTEVYSTVIRVQDPIITLGGITAPVIDDNKDRGVEFKWHDGSSTKVGFFGYDDSSQCFTFIPDAVNTAEVFSGTVGNACFNNITLAGNITNVTSITAGTLNTCSISCSGTMTISAVSGIVYSTPQITVPAGTNLLFGTTGSKIYQEPGPGCDLIIESDCNVFLTPGGTTHDVILPLSSGIIFSGEAGTQKIEATTSTSLTISSAGYTTFNNTTLGVKFTEGLPLILNTAETTKIIGKANGDLELTGNGDVKLIPTTGDVTIPQGVSLEMGSETETIVGTIGQLTLDANSTIYLASPKTLVESPELEIQSTLVTIEDPIITLGEAVVDVKDRGVEYKYIDGMVSKLGFFGWDRSTDSFTFIKDATNVGEVISGSPGSVRFGATSVTSLDMNSGAITEVTTVSGTGNISINPTGALNLNATTNVNIPVNTNLTFDGTDAKMWSDGTDLCVQVASPGIFCVDNNTVINGDLQVNGIITTTSPLSTVFTTEHVSIAGGAIGTISSAVNVSFITITGTGVGQVVMPTGGTDGLLKFIHVVQLATGTSFELTFLANRFTEPCHGLTASQKMIFSTQGQSVTLVWNNIKGMYFIVNGGAKVVLA